MKNTVALALALASAGLASAQAVYGADSTFTCTKPNAAYCAGSSLGTDIIIRCNGTVGQPGRCGNNLAGQPPLGSGGALCYQTSPEAGDAACEKNCVVYAPSSSFTLPASLCTPTYTATTQSLSTTIIIETPHPTNSLTTTTIIDGIPTTKKTTCTESLSTTIIVDPIPTSTKKTTAKTTAKTTDTTCTESLSTTIIVEPIPTPTKSYTQTNSTLTRSTTTFITTPTGTNRPPPVTAGAANNKAMGGLAVVGLAAAYLL
ncbi:hypothetical protein B0T14DRAFT_298369 [Immersiella caudata]|uniref:Uncharacterized protein n=1 Tax=Immersiella caudata TaxID=314043 RepID=A0AA40BUK1_9PEZI|nr:hypothetical protein B0T14DRAFT_298369 [Immersiella caudata]